VCRWALVRNLPKPSAAPLSHLRKRTGHYPRSGGCRDPVPCYSQSMNSPQTRRRFLRTSLGTAVFAFAGSAAATTEPASFAFILLDDLHYDKLEHHDMGWLERHKAGDLGQIRNYSRIMTELMPRLFAAVLAGRRSRKLCLRRTMGVPRRRLRMPT
jgi:hypothetical protein